MDYSIGSVADLISGSTTPNKPKVVQKIVKTTPKTPVINHQGNDQVVFSGKKGKKRSFSPLKSKTKKLNASQEYIEESDIVTVSENTLTPTRQVINGDEVGQIIATLKRSNKRSFSPSKGKTKLVNVSQETNEEVKVETVNDNGPIPKKNSMSPRKTKDIKQEIGDNEQSGNGMEYAIEETSGITENKPLKKKKGKKNRSNPLIETTQMKQGIDENEESGNNPNAMVEEENAAIENKPKLKKKAKKNRSESLLKAKPGKQDTNDDKAQSLNETPKDPKHTTIFVGNLPTTTTHQKLEKLFSKLGKVVNARIRSVPVADPNTPKKVAFIKKQFHADRKSMHGYVTFATPEDAHNALALNGTEYKDHHIRVNLCNEKVKPDNDKAIFLGNVSFAAEEEELWKLFEPCGEIESVRLIRDRRTDIGKGFGYINFKSADSVELALQMGEVKLRDRVLRLSLYNGKAPKKPKEQKAQKKGPKVNKEGVKKEKKNKEDSSFKTATHGQFQGKFANEKKKKFNKGNQQKKRLAKKIAPRTMTG